VDRGASQLARVMTIVVLVFGFGDIRQFLIPSFFNLGKGFLEN